MLFDISSIDEYSDEFVKQKVLHYEEDVTLIETVIISTVICNPYYDNCVGNASIATLEVKYMK